MTKIIATSKERLVLYLDFKGISYAKFFADTGIKRGFLDSDKLKATISDVFLAKIIVVYDDLDLVWLITGNGEMIQRHAENRAVAEEGEVYQKLDAFSKVFGYNKAIDKKLDYIIDMLHGKLESIDGTIGKLAILQEIEKEIEEKTNEDQ